jgi:flagellar motor switch protein FliN
MTPLEEIAGFDDVPVLIEAEFGRPLLKIRDILSLEAGNIVGIARAAGENLDIRVGGVLIGCGEVVVSENGAGVRLTDFKGEG